MVEEKKSKLFFLGIFPKCPFYKLLPLLFIIAQTVLGTLGIYFLNLWVAVVYLIYAILWYFLVQPIVHCKYCYYKSTETKVDSSTGKSIEKLLSKELWLESCFQKHVECGKKWSPVMMISWFLPIILIVISLFLNFSIVALILLISFIGVVAAGLAHMRWKVCPTCVFVKECHEAF